MRNDRLLPALFTILMSCCHQSEKATSTAPGQASLTATQSAIPLCRGAIARLSLTDSAAPVFHTGVGNVHLAVDTQSADAQRWFDQGLNLLYDFWHIEAYRAFRQAIRADSTCAMAYWGLALCRPGFATEDNQEWVRASNRAMALRTPLSPMHRALIEATATLTTQGPDAAFPQFQTLIQTYPTDADAVATAAIIMRQSNKDMNGPVGNALKASLERAIKQHPTHHGLLHHYIHILELRPDHTLAQPVAWRMVKLAPNAPHITHMPGHLYYLAGQYGKAVAVYQQARRQEEAYHALSGVPRDANQNYLHNLHFLAVAEAEMGHYEQALEAAYAYANTNLTTTTTNGGTLMLLYEGRILPALVHIRFRQWQKATDHLNHWLTKANKPLTDPLVRSYLEAMRAYSQGMMATETGDLTAAQQQLNQLVTLMQQYNTAGSQQRGHMAFQSINETYDIMDIARLELTGWLANRQGGVFNGQAFTEAMQLEKLIAYDEPPRLTYPVAESLGMLHFRRGEPALARQAFQQALKQRPDSPLIRQYLNQSLNQ